MGAQNSLRDGAMNEKNVLGHFLTLITVFIWGVTFISTKVLLKWLSPVEILFYRFVIGFILLAVLHPHIFKPDTLREEILFAGLGVAGVVIYFLMENIALQYTQAANVSLLVAAAPVLTAFAAHWTTKDEKLAGKLIAGFLVAFTGIFLVIFNGSYVLKLDPVGDLLAVLAAASWAVYSVLLKKVNPRLNSFYVTGRIFCYGILFTIPALLIFRDDFMPAHPPDSGVILNILFLGVFASAACYVMWNRAVKLIGAIKASNYIYLIPLITMIASVAILDEKVNGIMILGGGLILSGVFIGERGLKIFRQFIPQRRGD
jgi:drug/metabolite transporter (DMT)-like permease